MQKSKIYFVGVTLLASLADMMMDGKIKSAYLRHFVTSHVFEVVYSKSSHSVLLPILFFAVNNVSFVVNNKYAINYFIMGLIKYN